MDGNISLKKQLSKFLKDKIKNQKIFFDINNCYFSYFSLLIMSGHFEVESNFDFPRRRGEP